MIPMERDTLVLIAAIVAIAVPIASAFKVPFIYASI